MPVMRATASFWSRDDSGNQELNRIKICLDHIFSPGFVEAPRRSKRSTFIRAVVILFVANFILFQTRFFLLKTEKDLSQWQRKVRSHETQ